MRLEPEREHRVEPVASTSQSATGSTRPVSLFQTVLVARLETYLIVVVADPVVSVQSHFSISRTESLCEIRDNCGNITTFL
jgi:hypothetical protein